MHTHTHTHTFTHPLAHTHSHMESEREAERQNERERDDNFEHTHILSKHQFSDIRGQLTENSVIMLSSINKARMTSPYLRHMAIPRGNGLSSS